MGVRHQVLMNGVDYVGLLPPGIQTTLTFSAGMSSRSTSPGDVRQSIDFLTGRTARPVIRARGMEPIP